MKVLQIVEAAYRGTLEEQDDTVVWITHAMKGAGGELDLLLCGNAVNYGLEGQNAAGLAFGDWTQTEPPRIDQQVAGLLAKGVSVFYVADDAARRGVSREAMIDGLAPVARAELPALLAGYDHAWHW